MFFDKFPKEVVKDCTEFSLNLLKDDYNKLCEHIENVENKSTLTEKTKINLAYYSDYRGKHNHASLYSYMKGYFSLVSQPVSDYTLNVYDVRCKLDIIQTQMNPYMDNGEDLNKYLNKRKLTKTEKRDTFTYFTKIIDKYIIPTFEKKDYINDYEMKLDLQINDVNVTDVKHVSKCIKDDKPINNLQLQAILYYIQKRFLQVNGSPAFKDNIEARHFGPCISNIYYHFCIYGIMPIVYCHETFNNIKDSDKIIIDEIIERTRNLDSWIRLNDTRKKHGAWDKVYRNRDGNDNIIPTDFIKLEN